MKRTIFLALGLTLVAALSLSAAATRRVMSSRVAAVGAQPTQTRKTSARTTRTVREINLEGLQRLLGRKGQPARPLLVNFWATWCEPCRDEFPDLVQIDKEYRARGLEFVTVSLDDVAEIKTTVPQFLREMRATMPTYLLNVPDPEPAIKWVDAEWGGGLPATYLYDAQGQLVFKHNGRVRAEELRPALDKVTGGK